MYAFAIRMMFYFFLFFVALVEYAGSTGLFGEQLSPGLLNVIYFLFIPSTNFT